MVSVSQVIYVGWNGRSVSSYGYGRALWVACGPTGPKMGVNRRGGGAQGPKGRGTTFWDDLPFLDGIGSGGW